MQRTHETYSPSQKVTSVVIDPGESLGAMQVAAFMPQKDELMTTMAVRNKQWDGFAVELEFYYCPFNWWTDERVLRIYRELGKLAGQVLACYKHIEPKILNHCGFWPFDHDMLCTVADEMNQELDDVKDYLQLLVDYEFYDLGLAQEYILSSVDLQAAALRLGYKVPAARIRIPVTLLLAPYRERKKWCAAVDNYNHQLIRAYTKRKYNDLCLKYEDEETMQNAIDRLSPRIPDPKGFFCAYIQENRKE